MAVRIESLVWTLDVDSRKFQQSVRRARRDFRRSSRAIQQDLGALSRFALRTATAVAAAYTALGAQVISTQLEIVRGARNAQVSVQQFATFGALFRSVGIDAEGLQTTFINLRDRIQELRDGNQTFIDDFGLLNLTLQDFEGLTAPQQLLTFLQAMRDTEDVTARTAAATRILTTEGERLGTLVESLSNQQIVSLQDRMTALGVTIDETAAGALVRLRTEAEIVSSTLGARFAQGLLDSFQRIEQRVGNFDGVLITLGDAAEYAGQLLAGTVDWLVRNSDALLTLLKYTGLFVAAWAAWKALALGKAFATLLISSAKLIAAFAVANIKLIAIVGVLIGIAVVVNTVVQNWDNLGIVVERAVAIVSLNLNVLKRDFLELLDVLLDGMTRFLDSLARVARATGNAGLATLLDTTSATIKVASISIESSLDNARMATSGLVDDVLEANRAYHDIEWVGPLDALGMTLDTVKGKLAGLVPDSVKEFFNFEIPQAADRLDDIQGRFVTRAEAATVEPIVGDLSGAAETASVAQGLFGPNIGEDLRMNFNQSIVQAFDAGSFRPVTESIRDTFLDSLHQNFANRLTDVLGDLFNSIIGNLQGRESGFLSGLGNLFAGLAPTSHRGNNRITSEGLVNVDRGQYIFTEEQVSRMLGAGSPSFTFQIQGDVTEETIRVINENLPLIANRTTQIQQEAGLLAR